MGRKITVILRDGTELTYKNAMLVEGNKTWIYQVNKNEHPEELLAFIDPNHIRKLYTEEDWYSPWPNQQVCNDLSLCCFPHASEYPQCIIGFLLSCLRWIRWEEGKFKVKTDSQTKCANCGATYSYVEQGRREYFIPWGPYFLCDMCHRLAILEVLQPESKPPFEPSNGWSNTHWIILYGLVTAP